VGIPWTEDELALLRRLANEPLSYPQVAERFPKRTVGSVRQKMETLHLARSARKAVESASKHARETEAMRAELELYRAVDAGALTPAKWQRTKPRGGHHGIACMVLSDPHYGEVVRPEQVAGYNAYNDKIAEQRTRRFFDKGISLARDYVQGMTYDGCVLFLPGDNLSGVIHEELARTNERPLLESVFYWADRLVPGLRMLADDFGKLTVPCVVGNHPRLSKKPVSKNRAQDNVDWVLYRLLAREFRDDPRVTFMISDAADLLVPVYDTTYLLTHGDQFRGGTGISAQFSPLMLGQARKTRRQLVLGKPYDWMVMGHWHSYVPDFHGIIASGTLKGYDEYAYIGNFEPEVPKLAFWITTPERGAGFFNPIEPMDRKAEGW
jgi:hypothetical protein